MTDGGVLVDNRQVIDNDPTEEPDPDRSGVSVREEPSTCNECDPYSSDRPFPRGESLGTKYVYSFIDFGLFGTDELLEDFLTFDDSPQSGLRIDTLVEISALESI